MAKKKAGEDIFGGDSTQAAEIPAAKAKNNTESSMENTKCESIYVLIGKVMSSITGVGKNEKNTAQNFKFRGIDAIMNAVGPALREYGVFILPTVEENFYDEVKSGKNQTPMGHARVKVRYTFYGPSGDSVSCVVPAEAMDSGDKATNKAMSMAFKAALIQSLCLPTNEADPDAESYTRSEYDDQQQDYGGNTQKSAPPVDAEQVKAIGSEMASALEAARLASGIGDDEWAKLTTKYLRCAPGEIFNVPLIQYGNRNMYESMLEIIAKESKVKAGA